MQDFPGLGAMAARRMVLTLAAEWQPEQMSRSKNALLVWRQA
jgi:hypothetical protein